jgi:hypothetical protein
VPPQEHPLHLHRFELYHQVSGARGGVDALQGFHSEARQVQAGPVGAHKELGRKPAQAIVKVVKDELDVAAKALGLADAKALRAELRGSSLAAVAQKHNVPSSTVANAIKADLNAKIDALVSSGKLKAERAATLEQRAAERVDKLMTREFTAKP